LETIGRDLNEMQRVPLAQSHVAAMRTAGSVAHYSAGTFLVHPGDAAERFVYVSSCSFSVGRVFSAKAARSASEFFAAP
jgi:thioredoxin reductase (NADPH)